MGTSCQLQYKITNHSSYWEEEFVSWGRYNPLVNLRWCVASGVFPPLYPLPDADSTPYIDIDCNTYKCTCWKGIQITHSLIIWGLLTKILNKNKKKTIFNAPLSLINGWSGINGWLGKFAIFLADTRGMGKTFAVNRCYLIISLHNTNYNSQKHLQNFLFLENCPKISLLKSQK